MSQDPVDSCRVDAIFMNGSVKRFLAFSYCYCVLLGRQFALPEKGKVKKSRSNAAAYVGRAQMCVTGHELLVWRTGSLMVCTHSTLGASIQLAVVVSLLAVRSISCCRCWQQCALYFCFAASAQQYSPHIWLYWLALVCTFSRCALICVFLCVFTIDRKAAVVVHNLIYVPSCLYSLINSIKLIVLHTTEIIYNNLAYKFIWG